MKNYAEMYNVSLMIPRPGPETTMATAIGKGRYVGKKRPRDDVQDVDAPTPPPAPASSSSVRAGREAVLPTSAKHPPPKPSLVPGAGREVTRSSRQQQKKGKHQEWHDREDGRWGRIREIG